MLISLPDLVRKYDLKINGIIHAGAHLAEEYDVYEQLGINPVYWIEANPAVVDRIRATFHNDHHFLVQALLSDQDDIQTTFHVTNHDGLSSSLLHFGTHTEFSPEIHFTHDLLLNSVTLDTLVKRCNIAVSANFLNMDLQGAELLVLKGATELLESIDYIYCEINNKEVYIDAAMVWELDEFLTDFKRVETMWVADQGWGDGFWIKEK